MKQIFSIERVKYLIRNDSKRYYLRNRTNRDFYGRWARKYCIHNMPRRHHHDADEVVDNDLGNS